MACTRKKISKMLSDDERPEIMSPYPNSIEIIEDYEDDFELIQQVLLACCLFISCVFV